MGCGVTCWVNVSSKGHYDKPKCLYGHTHTNFSCVYVPVLIALHVLSGCKSVCIATLWVTQIVWGQKARLHYINQYILGGRHDKGQGLVKIRFSVIHIAVVVMVTICQQEMNVSQYNVL